MRPTLAIVERAQKEAVEQQEKYQRVIMQVLDSPMVRAAQDAMQSLQKYNHVFIEASKQVQKFQESYDRVVEPMLKAQEQIELFSKSINIGFPRQMLDDAWFDKEIILSAHPPDVTRADVVSVEQRIQALETWIEGSIADAIEKEFDKHFQRGRISSGQNKPEWVYCSYKDCKKQLMKIKDVAFLAETMSIYRCPHCKRDLQVPHELRIN